MQSLQVSYYNVLLKEFNHAQLGEEIFREIAAKSFNAQDTKGSSRNSQNGLREQS
ncbi:hypothetical protein BGW80DRAFT_1303903 [Lactifluus volemus]|nr:hypothetical protein BGW80DRAFT_1303903 [Lactifluus volemus]